MHSKCLANLILTLQLWEQRFKEDKLLMIPQRIPKYLSPALKSLLCKFSPISETQAVRKLTSPSGTKYMKRLKETEPPRMPDPEYSEMVLSLFRNSLGNLR